MPNSYFRFKEFIINQDKSAMKVCTDACLFGAWVASKTNPAKALDIGTGTGLLSLMLAQKTSAVIDAVEIDKNAAKQAGDNFTSSPWNDRLTLINSSIQEFDGFKYDLIISNPPFFVNDLKSADASRNIALHSEMLSLEELVSAAKKMLSENGQFAVLLPFHRREHFEGLIKQNDLFIRERMTAHQTPRHQPFRVFYLVAYSRFGMVDETITIKDANGLYTAAFNELLKDYYL